MSWAELPNVTLRAALSGAGPRQVVLLHELGGSLDSFDDVAALLVSSATVLRYDQRGAGLSEKPRAAFEIADHAADLAALLRWSGAERPVFLAGVAAACAILVEFALAYPDAVAGLLLCGPVLSAAGPAADYLRTRSDRAMREGMRAVVDTSLERSYPPHLRGDGARFADYRARMLGADPVGYAHANLALVAASTETGAGQLRCPVDVLAGLHDRLRGPDEIAATAAAIPGARFTIVDSGHLMAVQTPGLVADAMLRLINRVEGTEP